MKRICAWCTKVIEYDDNPGTISHGICLDCEERLYEEEGWNREPIKVKGGKKKYGTKIID